MSSLTVDFTATRLLVDDAARNNTIANLAAVYRAHHLDGAEPFLSATALEAFSVGVRAGLALAVAGADAAESVAASRGQCGA